MPNKLLVVINQDDQIIEKIPCDNTNFTEQRQLEKDTRKRYADKGMQVKVRVGYVNVSEELFESTKKLLEETFEKYPEMGEAFVKDRPEFRHLGYNINKKYKR